MDIDNILKKQRKFFKTGVTYSVEIREGMLKSLYTAVKSNEKDIAKALKKDLGKSEYESVMCETGMVLSEISFMLKHIRKFAAPRKVKTPMAQFHSVSYKKKVPYGNVLVMSPWNYPFLISLGPLVDAVAAGNTVVIKPSAYSPATSEIVKKIVEECFPEEYVAVVTGGREENKTLLEKKFDMVFFTGSQSVGKEVLKRCAEHLTPAVLELGGKSPCIVDETADIALAAKRIVFGKFLNCGQTCVAPDYIYCSSKIKDRLIEEIKKQIELQYGENPLKNNNYGKIINRKHFERICRLIDGKKVVCGGNIKEETLQIEPTVMDNISWDDDVMKEEIFGPVLPVMTYDIFEEVYDVLSDKAKPLALYIFSRDKKRIDFVTERIQFGGGCVNDTIIHLATSNMGFGGVGESGMGAYHGKAGFNAFSHTKSIVDKKNWIDLPMRYQPYNSKTNSKLLKMFLK